MLHLVNQLMDYRRAELGIFKLRPIYANAYKKVLNCFLNYESLSKRKDIDYNLYTELQDEELLFDETYLDLIVNNLLSNAFKYTEKENVSRYGFIKKILILFCRSLIQVSVSRKKNRKDIRTFLSGRKRT